MNYLNIEKFFTENKLEELLNLYAEDFESIDEFSKQFINNLLISGVECQEALDVLTGLYMKLNVVYSIADYYYQKKKEIDKMNKDLTMNTMAYLRVRNIFKAYLDSVKRSISTSQSQLKYWISEINNKVSYK